MLLRAIRIVLSGFVGVRNSARHKKDMENIHPVMLIITGVFLVLIFVGVILLVVKSIVPN